jgi:hypothetical protein
MRSDCALPPFFSVRSLCSLSLFALLQSENADIVNDLLRNGEALIRYQCQKPWTILDKSLICVK